MRFLHFTLHVFFVAKICFAYSSGIELSKNRCQQKRIYMNTNDVMPTEKINSINTRCYNAKADNWDRLPFGNFLPEQILMTHQTSAGMDALDIGSGTGMLAEWLAKNEFSVTCLDPADEMVRRCREKGLTTEQTTVQEFSCDKKFGLITAILSLIHVPKREISAQLTRIAHWLNPQGTFVLALIEGNSEGIGERYSKYPRYFSYYTRQEILDLTKNEFTCVYEMRTGAPISYLVFIFQKKK